MSPWLSRGLAFVGLSYLLFGNAYAGVIVNLNSSLATNAQSLYLSAGQYQITPVGFADGGVYEAWNAWGKVEGCNAAGAKCTKGWINTYFFASTLFSEVKITDGGRYATAPLALSHAKGSSFSLYEDALVSFYIADTKYSDNQGGVSLEVISMPEPVSVGLLGLAVCGLLASRRRV